MGAELRAIRARIRSVRSTAKITRAQELIASSRIPKARQRLEAARPYAEEITRVSSIMISHGTRMDHALLNRRPDTSRVAVLVMSSDRGFCGAFNNNALRQGDALATLLREQGKEPTFYLCGRKAVDFYRFRHRKTEREWVGLSDSPVYEVAAEIGQTLVEAFDMPTREGGVGEVHVVFTEFVSMLNQQTRVHRILPLEIEEQEIGGGGEGSLAAPPPPYEFEPNPGAVLDMLLRQYVRGRIWRMLLESSAAEHASRRQAMMSATENAHELVAQLTRRANSARQGEITTELTEISGGAEALAHSKAED
ncbi:F0F1 ATP synthase subunit gamma [Streptosporangium carneum]|uniref:ATP synthase gamma chain n=1 Tax=Streptosporangium carneum TaxID=47481 RepID=A0A9W6I2D7_9ACTN|nr:F0F1 ATP synthase subunit gamma [Streptosporangium carneum]GLK10755.1 ATP synthase gamma chain [Streptosporangium carneum]